MRAFASLGMGLLAMGAAGCQSVAQPAGPGVALAAAGPATPVSLPDSLRPTPVPAVAGVPDTLRQAIAQLYSQLGSDTVGLRPAVLAQACVGYLTLHPSGRIERGGVLAVADMDLPNTAKRLWVIDLQQGKVLENSLVAHGQGSGHLRARRFSNQPSSNCTSLGFYRTSGTYAGKHGYSRRLLGLDKGQNANAFDRYVVLHAADYASPAYVEAHGHLGYSQGCPALPPEQYKQIISTLRTGSLLLLSGPGLASRWLDGPAAGRRFARRGWR
ncbi:murein L,D-transpeptidase catalytic domain family protein [Hymenobacter sp. RP-2-7]|uniref:Murein L,D-transpeptidase catalytic domain family protein n=1 Tax=Hymenobacter polaris TaxID=2682546 RepID=A0A7Y0ACX2_9BACT|nr:murein L,D-transpeptidase catalytic domain family protein [Hymenobacter polaris]NML65048.1 murein L,D-transpeptidase catalytic domain family protein [Hymenobacter polaris]